MTLRNLLFLTAIPTFFTLLASSATGATRTLGSRSTSGFGQDSNASFWLLTDTSTSINGVAVKMQTICTNQTSNGTICTDGAYTFLYQVAPQGPYVITLDHLSGYAYNNNSTFSFGLMDCDTADPPNNTLALCSSFYQNDQDFTSYDFPNATLSVSVPSFSSGNLTFYLQENQNPAGPLIAPVVSINGVSLTPSSITFGSLSQAAGYVPLTKLWTLTNTLPYPLMLSSLGAYPGFVTSSSCGKNVPSGATCAISVQPDGSTVPSALTAHLNFGDNSAVSNEQSSISFYPSHIVTVHPNSLSFGTRDATGTDTTALHAILINDSGPGFTIGSVTVNPDPSTGQAEFALENSSTCTASLNLTNGSTCTLDIGFPNGTGDTGHLFGTVSVTNNDTGDIYTLALEGFAGSPFLDQSNLSFGNQPVGITSIAQTVTFTNTSGGTINIAGVTPSADFTAQTGTCVDPASFVTLANGASCTVDVRFRPSANGFRSGTITIADDLTDGTQVIVTSGRGGPPILFSPPVFDLGSAPLSSGNSRTFSLIRNTDTPVHISNTSFVGGNAGDFFLDNSKVCPSIANLLLSNSSCPVGINFNPTAAGPRRSSISVTDDAAGSPHSAILTGIGTAGAVSPSGLNFGSLNVGSSSSPLVAFVGNWGSTTLTIWQIVIGGTNPSDFSKTTTCGSTLAPTVLCNVDIMFTPQASGPRNATLFVNDDGGHSPHTVSLVGTGTGPIMSLSATALAFGDQALTTTSSAQIVTLGNVGTGPMTISSIGISGANSADFLVQSNVCPLSPGTLAVNTSCSFSVAFAPTAAGPRKSSVSIVDDAPGSPQSILLTGNGTTPPAAPAINGGGGSSATFTSSSVSFGSQVVGTSPSARFVGFKNSGRIPIIIRRIAIPAGAGSRDFTVTSDCGKSLAPGQSCTLHVTFAPRLQGASHASIRILDSSPEGSHELNLNGTGVPAGKDLAPSGHQRLTNAPVN